MQLFDKNYYANDLEGCIAEFDGHSIENTISQVVNWIIDTQELT